MNIITMDMIDPVTGQVKDKDEHLFDSKKPVYSKDDVKQLNRMLKSAGKSKNTSYSNNSSSGRVAGGKTGKSKYGISKVTGKERTSSPEGYKCSAKCRPEVALGHNNRDPDWVKNRENVDPYGYHKTYLDCGSIEKCYAQVFDEFVDEYNSRQTRNDRKIKSYYRKILEDGRNGTMKKNADVDTHRKLIYEFIFQIGKRDHRLDTQKSIEILEKFATEYMPEHFPNLKAVGIYLHADEFTVDPVTGERLEGAVHIHFDFIPVAHALTKEELEEEKKWRKELEQKARDESKAKGEKFSKTKFDDQDWEMLRVQKFGKALQKGMLLQSSMSGACAEMGFRTKGKLTAQIQMEEEVRIALLDFAESYGIKVNRDVSEEKQEAVHIDEYKAREDNKRILEQIEIKNLENKELEKHNSKVSAELTKREAGVANLEKEKAEAVKMSEDAKALEAKVAPYVERIDTLDEDEEAVEKRKAEQDARDNSLNEKEKQIEKKESESLERIAEKQSNLDKDIADFEEDKKSVEEIRKANEAAERINSENARRNEANAKANRQRSDDFYETQYQYRMMQATCGYSNEISKKVETISEELKNDLHGSALSWREAVDAGVEKFSRKCKQIILKFKDAICGFHNFLEGKTSGDFRNLADDMDRNGTKTFEEYEKKHMEGKLDWQVREKEQQYSLKPVKKVDRGISWDD